MNFKPLGDRVVIKQDDVQETTKGGLLLTSGSKEKPTIGIVVAVGEGRYDNHGKLIPMPVKAGDKVMYGKYSGNEITIDGADYVLCRAEDLLGVFAE
ncbi:MAG: co-chaperone GroES [Eggerthellaceae bacterium]|nr:co-chaperone GroES [Eggerthellaceae bacterium]